jgi:hypothetical protein
VGDEDVDPGGQADKTEISGLDDIAVFFEMARISPPVSAGDACHGGANLRDAGQLSIASSVSKTCRLWHSIKHVVAALSPLSFFSTACDGRGTNCP